MEKCVSAPLTEADLVSKTAHRFGFRLQAAEARLRSTSGNSTWAVDPPWRDTGPVLAELVIEKEPERPVRLVHNIDGREIGGVENGHYVSKELGATPSSKLPSDIWDRGRICLVRGICGSLMGPDGDGESQVGYRLQARSHNRAFFQPSGVRLFQAHC